MVDISYLLGVIMVSHHRSSGHNAVRMAKMRVISTDKFKLWYFNEHGVVLTDEAAISFRTGFNMGCKYMKKHCTKIES